ncbi:MAG: dTMP kinase [Coriobacteriia bacterium]|nr:dTMP kinase [Coriobacteriia bacterium]
MSDAISYQLPLSPEERARLRAGQNLRLSGSCYTLRDASLARLAAAATADEAATDVVQLLELLKGQLIFFAGPTPPHPRAPDLPFGSIGPTTACRMDAAQIALMSRGMLVTLGKGARSAAYTQAACDHGALYLAAVGGAAAVLAQHVVAGEVVAWPELGTEAIMRLELRDFPAVVAIDTCGGDVYAIDDAAATDVGLAAKLDSWTNSAKKDTVPCKAGTFITFEGGEGTGKSTQIELLAKVLQAAGQRVLTLREPGSSAISEDIRAILLDVANGDLSARAELFLYQAARAQLTDQVIGSALAQGMVVLCDRFFDSTTAYQGHARGLDIDQIAQLNLLATDGLTPDLSIVLDIPPEIGLQRAARTGTPDRLEQEDLAFHQQVRAGFLAIAAAEPQRVFVVDATQDTAVIAAEIYDLLLQKLPQLTDAATEKQG